MNRRIGLVHATLAAVEPVVRQFRAQAPDTAVLHFLDEGLLPLVEREGLSKRAVAELERLIARAVSSNVQGVLLTCSAYSPAVPDIQQRFALPIESVDEAMLRCALQHGSRIGVVATVTKAGPTTEALLRAYAAKDSQDITVSVAISPEAFAALQRGDVATHDQLIRERIASLLSSCDVVVLAQISMARALENAPAFPKPVLTSAELGVRAILSRVDGTARAS